MPLSSLNFGQIYTALDKLERDGYLSHRTVEQEERPAKKVFALTESGRAELASWMRSASVPDLDLRNPTFFKLLLARGLDPAVGCPDVLEVIRGERRACFERLHEVVAARARASGGEQPLGASLLLDLAALRLEAFLSWLDRCEAALAADGGGSAGGLGGGNYTEEAWTQR